ncbi:hypothetical protein ACSBR2_029405 [Camellia fascicularis]
MGSGAYPRDHPDDDDDDDDDQQELLSCWGRLKLKLKLNLPLERRRRSQRSQRSTVGWNLTNIFKSKQPRSAGFRYDPLSYAQNFDEGWDEDDEDSLHRGFSSRYAAPSLK